MGGFPQKGAVVEEENVIFRGVFSGKCLRGKEISARLTYSIEAEGERGPVYMEGRFVRPAIGRDDLAGSVGILRGPYTASEAERLRREMR